MKALKYGLTLVLGLTMLGFGARVQAQVSSQTADVVPAHATPLPEVPDAPVMEQPGVPADQLNRGVPAPKAVEELINKKEFELAIKEFDKFFKSAKGDACELIYTRYSFYSRLQMEDREHTAEHKAQCDACVADLERQCPDIPETYILKVRLYGEDDPESVVKWMDKAIEKDPTYSILYSIRADALWLLQEDEKACEDYKKAVEMGVQAVSMRYTDRCPQSQE